MVRVLQQLLRREWLPQQQQRFFCSALQVRPPLQIPERASEVREPAPVLPFAWGLFQLMAVPKRKVSRSKKGIRNGPKALKPQRVIIRCKSCGRVKLPHFYCCTGEKKD
eukprot:c12493_g1_i1 orf=530-856(-)